MTQLQMIRRQVAQAKRDLRNLTNPTINHSHSAIKMYSGFKETIEELVSNGFSHRRIAYILFGQFNVGPRKRGTNELSIATAQLYVGHILNHG